MKTATALGLCLLALGVAVAAGVSGTQAADEAAIREVVQLYFDGIIQYQETGLRKAFHPQANVIGTTNEGALDWEPFQDFQLFALSRKDSPIITPK